MADLVMTDAGILFHAYDIQGDMNQAALNYSADALDNTTFGKSTHQRIGGAKAVLFSGEGFFEAAEPDSALFTAVGVSDRPVTVVPEGYTEGNVAYFFRSVLGQYNPAASYGEILKFSVEAGCFGDDLIRGTLMARVANASSSANATARQLGAVASGESMYAVLHVHGTGGTPTLDVTVESDSTNSFSGAETTRITFAQATGLTSEWKSVAGAITDDWWRVAYTIGGTTPDMSFSVALGIL